MRTRRNITAGLVARLAVVAGWLMVAGVAGCQSPNHSPATRPSETSLAKERVLLRVRELMDRARADRQAARLDPAVAKLKEAVSLDSGSGPAQHLLGLVYYEKGDLYNAAIHLDIAARLLSDRYEPYYNLGRVLEAGGQYEQAIRSYQRSLSRRIDHLESIENLARVRLRAGYRDPETLRLLARCLDREQRPEWHAWLQSESDRLRAGLSREDPTFSLLQDESSGQTSPMVRNAEATNGLHRPGS